MLLCSHHENSSLSTAVYKQSCFASMEKQFVTEDPQQWLVPNRAQAISQGTGVRIIKATTPLGINCCPCWHTEKRDRDLSGPRGLASPLLSHGSLACGVLPRWGDHSLGHQLTWYISCSPCSSDVWAGSSGKTWPAWTGEQTALMGGGKEGNCLLDRASSLISPFPSVFILAVPLFPSLLVCFFPCFLPRYVIISKRKENFTLLVILEQ